MTPPQWFKVVNYELMLTNVPIIIPTIAFKMNRIVDQCISFFRQ